jgi:hypothetical protein
MNKKLWLTVLVLAVLAAAVLAIAVIRSDGTDTSGSTDTPATETAEPEGADPQNPNATKLDPAVQAYADAVAAEDLDAFVNAFAENGEVIDVSRPIRGHEAIRSWAQNEVIGGSMEVLDIKPVENGQDVLVRWTTASGSSWEAYYLFEVSDDKIIKVTFRYA